MSAISPKNNLPESPRLKDPDHRRPVAWRGLTIQLFVIIILPLATLLLIIAFGSISLHQKAMREMVGEHDERAVRAASSAIQSEIQHRMSAIQGLAARAVSSRPEDLNQVIANSAYLQQDFDGGLAFFSQDGRLLASQGDPTFWQYLASGKEPALANLLPQEAGSAAASTVFSHPVTGKPMLVVAAAAQQEGLVAVGALSPETLIQATLANSFPSDGQVSAYVVDSKGNLLFQNGTLPANQKPPDLPGAAQALQGNSGTIELQNGSYVVAYSPVSPVQWAIVSQEPWEKVAPSTLRTTQIAPLVLVPALLIAIFALWFIARQVVHPIQDLEAKAEKLALGDFKAIEDPVNGIEEIRHLQAELVEMAHKVQAAQRNLHSYIGAITKGQEEERRRMARDLHDDTLQTLIALKQRVQLAQMASQDEPSARALAELESLAEQTIDNLRRLTRALRPIYLEDLGLAAALEMLAQETGQTLQILVNFQRSGSERRLSPEAELALYRMAQEALSNVARHAQASSATLHISFSPQDVTLRVSDNGKGFTIPKSPSEFAFAGHFGLLGLHERADLIGAALQIQSAPGKGTQVTVRLPDASQQ